jgi:hypothetical protein
MLAASGAHILTVNLLLEHGADPHAKNSKGHTALDTAMMRKPEPLSLIKQLQTVMQKKPKVCGGVDEAVASAAAAMAHPHLMLCRPLLQQRRPRSAVPRQRRTLRLLTAAPATTSPALRMSASSAEGAASVPPLVPERAARVYAWADPFNFVDTVVMFRFCCSLCCFPPYTFTTVRNRGLMLSVTQGDTDHCPSLPVPLVYDRPKRCAVLARVAGTPTLVVGWPPRLESGDSTSVKFGLYHDHFFVSPSTTAAK